MKNSKKKLLQKMEKQDDKGIARKKHSNSISPSLFFFLKLICIVLIPIIYFVYSPFLIIIMGFYVFLFFLSIKAERRMNQSYLKSNKIKIPKFDSAIAMIVIMIALAGTCMSGNDKTQTSTFGNFNATQIEDFIGDNNFIGARQSGWWISFKTTLTNFATLLTGTRSVFEQTNQFGTMTPPEGLPSFEGEESMPHFNKPQNIDFDDIPIAYTFSSLLTSLNSVFIFLVPVAGFLSLVYVNCRIKKMDREINEVIFEEKITMLDENELRRILSFGEEQI